MGNLQDGEVTKMDIKNVISVPGLGTFGGGQQAAKPQVKPPANYVAPAKPAPVKVPESADKARYEAVRQATEAVKNLFAVSDFRFAIFKDIAGDYVTRFTSLRDGTVKYFPQKSLFEMAQIRTARLEGLFDTQA